MIAFALVTMQAAAAPPPLSLPSKPSDPIEADWQAIPDDEIMLITLGNGRQVIVRLAARFAPQHVANIRTLARTGWWDGLSAYRVQENWVVQWGDASEKKPLPVGVSAQPAPEFEIAGFSPAQRLTKPDAYSTSSGLTADGWPIATDGRAAWLTHCYGMVGVARDALPSTGSGAELFTPIGQSARRLDRNYTVVGLVIEGMANFSALPRSDAPMGVYATAAEATPIARVRMAVDLPAAERPHFQYRATDNIRFAAAVRLRENPDPPMVSLGGAEVCDVLPAVRRAPSIAGSL